MILSKSAFMILAENMKSNYWLFFLAYNLILLAITIYSYSQIDLNLTLSANYFYQIIQQKLIYLGYFNRHFSAIIYGFLYLFLFIFYFLIFKNTKEKKLKLNQVWILIFSTIFILLFSYPAFSHDIFNYIFDARILIYHQHNPWLYTALDFPTDLWTRFMHWTHRTYPYGPFWLTASLLPYTLGFGKFILTLFNFKLFLSLAYLGNCYLIYKIISLPAMVFFAFNPLVINESLVSPHLDGLMTLFGLLAIFLYLKRKKNLGLMSLGASILIKYATLGYLPLFFLKIKKEWRSWGAFTLTLIAIIIQILMRELLPWYFLPLFPLGVMLNNQKLSHLLVALSLGGILYYLPYLYFGDYTPVAKHWRNYLFISPLILSLLINLLNFFQKSE